MPGGSTASAAPDGSTPDTAPAESPVLVPLAVAPGMPFFFRASGSVTYSALQTPTGPEGNAGVPTFTHLEGAQNGIADLNSPLNALVGIFLGSSRPDISAPPPGLDFSLPATRDFLSLAPALKQPFFIGDGLAGPAHQAQVFFAPSGATRLFLGTWDEYTWADNRGTFGIETDSALIGDANLDGRVDFTDLLILAQHYGDSPAPWRQGNFNTDPTIDFSDLLLLAEDYGQSTAATQSEVPEPFCIAALAAAATLSRRRLRQSR